MGFPVSPSQSCKLNPNSSRCVIKRSLKATGSDFGPSA